MPPIHRDPPRGAPLTRHRRHVFREIDTRDRCPALGCFEGAGAVSAARIRNALPLQGSQEIQHGGRLEPLRDGAEGTLPPGSLPLREIVILGSVEF